MFRRLPALLASVLSLALGASAQSTIAGYFLDPAPGGGAFTPTATLSDGNQVAFDGQRVTLNDPLGNELQELALLAGTGYASFARVDPTETFAVVGESLNGGLYVVSLAGGATLLANLMFNFDASFLDEDTLYVSAFADGVGENDIFRVELSPVSLTKVADLPGASGPLAVGTGGELFYGTSDFPLPPGGSKILRFSSAQLFSGTVLGEGDATVVGAGFLGASSLAYDHGRGDLYLAASDFSSGLNHVYRVLGGPMASDLLVEGSPFGFLGGLELLAAEDARAQLRPYQPGSGPRLRVAGLSGRHDLASLRPTIFLTGPGAGGAGPFDLNVADGAPDGLAYTLVSASASAPPVELAVWLANQGLNLFLALDPFTLDFDPLPFALDGDGLGAKTYANPGLGGSVALQVLVLRPGGSIAGTTDAQVL